MGSTCRKEHIAHKQKGNGISCSVAPVKQSQNGVRSKRKTCTYTILKARVTGPVGWCCVASAHGTQMHAYGAMHVTLSGHQRHYRSGSLACRTSPETVASGAAPDQGSSNSCRKDDGRSSRYPDSRGMRIESRYWVAHLDRTMLTSGSTCAKHRSSATSTSWSC